jgi:hypothetical protein
MTSHEGSSPKKKRTIPTTISVVLMVTPKESRKDTCLPRLRVSYTDFRNARRLPEDFYCYLE